MILMTQPAEDRAWTGPAQAADLDTGARARSELGADLRARLAALANVAPEDDGSLRAALWDRPGLVDSMLGYHLLDPLELPDCDGEADPDGLPPQVSELLRVTGVVGIEDLNATIDAIATVRARVNALEALEGVLYERARRQALRAEVVDDTDPMVRTATGTRRRDLARRAVVADLALAVHHTEHTVTDRMNRAHALTARAPRTLAVGLTGQVPWVNAAKVADAVDALDPGVAAALDRAVAHPATLQNPRRFAATVRRTCERLHPTPAEVRHGEAASKRGVWVDDAADAMAYLTLLAPAPAIHAIASRLDQAARHARTHGDARTTAQLRADTAVALLLDDGTLDLAGLAGLAADGTATARTDGGNAVSGLAEPASERAADPTNERTNVDRAGLGDGRTAPDLAVLARSLRPRVYVTVPVLTLLGRSEEPALLDGTVPIDPDTARALAGLAPSFTRVLTHPVTGDILGVDATTYAPPQALRHHLTVRDTTCRFPGCGRRATATDADHTRDHALGGPTTDTNLALLCRHHHVLKHQARFAVHQRDDHSGTLTWTTPTGRTYATRPGLVPATVHSTLPGPIHVPDPDDEGGHAPGPPEDPDGDPPF
ncbi:HNH endonuclease [Xylanimonas cellulosilytica DSM 15894]|uniref:HNH endonuclease n=2 Tax=Xylanimonas TaxID=186188 RepID=D1C0I8_XYLCX|nr:HNH endonuclease [Xylanimonas cellulosilytica DSM 15894]